MIGSMNRQGGVDVIKKMKNSNLKNMKLVIFLSDIHS